MVETATIYGRRILHGITRYLRSHEPWSVFLEQHELGAEPPPWLSRWRGQGVITRVMSGEFAAWLRKTKLAVVDLNDRIPNVGFPRINSDDETIGRLAAEHLLDRGFRSFGYCGFSGELWADRRQAGFARRLAAAGFECTTFQSPWVMPRTATWERQQEQITTWLSSLSRPVGLLTCNDMRGQHVLDACTRLGWSVPEEAAVIGVDDDALLCELCEPPLSSVIPNPERLGYEAAELLDQLMRGETATAEDRFLPPVGVSTRQSTDVLAIDDPQTAAAVRFIREHACQGAGVADVLLAVPQSRTALERKFRKYLGRSPQAEIRNVQIKRAKQLLAETDLKLDRIAELTGFEHPEYLSVVFKRITGQTPGQFRRGALATPHRA
uniref:DNA-binding transcriptional regulator n=1 Tax=Schlesneria paludicola TaxID=360056 RepID=A0A7C2JYV1_9PLAN